MRFGPITLLIYEELGVKAMIIFVEWAGAATAAAKSFHLTARYISTSSLPHYFFQNTALQP